MNEKNEFKEVFLFGLSVMAATTAVGLIIYFFSSVSLLLTALSFVAGIIYYRRLK